jgi:hypothetical protein
MVLEMIEESVEKVLWEKGLSDVWTDVWTNISANVRADAMADVMADARK